MAVYTDIDIELTKAVDGDITIDEKIEAVKNFEIEKIFVLPKGKGNSSQQMGNYGRTEIRKCVYLWRKK